MADQSSVGTHLAELYNNIQQFQQERDDATRKLEKAKKDFASYLKQSGIDKLLQPESDSQTNLFGILLRRKKEPSAAQTNPQKSVKRKSSNTSVTRKST